jgi:hypothetical protein
MLGRASLLQLCWLGGCSILHALVMYMHGGFYHTACTRGFYHAGMPLALIECPSRYSTTVHRGYASPLQALINKTKPSFRGDISNCFTLSQCTRVRHAAIYAITRLRQTRAALIPFAPIPRHSSKDGGLRPSYQPPGQRDHSRQAADGRWPGRHKDENSPMPQQPDCCKHVSLEAP